MPPLQTLVILVKALLAKRCLNVPYNGGLGSFAVVMLVGAFLI
jgi:DNA polymerase sigma